MNATTALQKSLESTHHLVKWYVSDLSDADLLTRPVPGANHIAWQLGHLIVGLKFLVNSEVPSASYPELPEGFAEKHDNKNAGDDNPKGFLTKDAYVDLTDKMHQATLAALKGLSDADLDRPTKGAMAKYAPTLGDLFLLVSNHNLMHAGQFTVLRRKLGKPVLF